MASDTDINRVWISRDLQTRVSSHSLMDYLNYSMGPRRQYQHQHQHPHQYQYHQVVQCHLVQYSLFDHRLALLHRNLSQA